MNEDLPSSSKSSSSSTTTLNQITAATNLYLKKHKLDVILLPNKKIKLSDLTSINNTNLNEIQQQQQKQYEKYKKQNDLTDLLELEGDEEEESEFHIEPQNEGLIDDELNIEVLEDDDDEDEVVEEDDDYDDEDSKIEQFLNETILNTEKEQEQQHQEEEYEEDEEGGSSSCSRSSKNIIKRERRKREPSLKLIQKLNTDDLQLIVNCVKSQQAHVFIADVKKDNYVDKILKVILIDDKLSNGSNEALLKKSMFPKDLNMLFDSFVRALCTERILIENNIEKPGLLCQVIDCNFYSFSEAEIIRHIKRHLAQDGYTCDKCGNQFASMTNLQRHLRIHSGDYGKEIKCPHCDYKASTSTHVKRHMAHKHLERSLPCPHCTFMGATNAELKIHMARKHLELTGKNPLFLPKYLKKDYQCSVCKKQYTDFKEYQAHMYEHTSNLNRFQCSMCPYNCKNYSKLKRHMLYHSGARNYECSICGNKFFQMEHLKRHMQSIHHQEINNTKQEKAASGSTGGSGERRARSLVSSNKISQLPTSVLVPQTTQQTLINEETSTIIQDPNQNGICYKVISKCSYKCQQCDFSTVKLYSLNEHVLLEHINDTTIDLVSPRLTTLNEFLCGFCSYKTDKKTNLKRHLQNNHSSQLTVPLLLSNDAVMAHPTTRFQCGLCRRYNNTMNDFVKHLTDKHKLPVYILDSLGGGHTNENSLQEQLKTHGRAQLICTSQQESTNHHNNNNNNNNQDETATTTLIINSNQNLIHVVDRPLIQQHQQPPQTTTVRINPNINQLLQKRNTKIVQQTKRQQQSQLNQIQVTRFIHDNTSNLIVDDETSQAIYQITNELQQHATQQEQDCSNKIIQMMY